MKPKLVSVLSLFFVALASAVPALAQQANSIPIVIPPVSYDISPPLVDLVASAPPKAPTGQGNIPLRQLARPSSAPLASVTRDLSLQQLSLPLVSTTPGLNFDGIGADAVIPPDTNGSVGATQFVQILNVEYAVYDKTSGALLLGPTLIHNIWSGFNGDCATGDGSDPVVLYDKAAGRWVVGVINVNLNAYCMAVSTTSDATKSYFRYEFPFGTNNPDYPKLAVWPDAYYWTANTFSSAMNFLGANPCAFDRATMLSGGPANAICMQQNSSVDSLLPADLDGTTPPPAGEPNFYLQLATPGSLNLYKFHVDFTTPANSTFTGPTAIPVASFSQACGGGTCIPQSGTTQQLDSLGDRLMFRLAYRNFGDHESLVVNHSVTAGTSVGVRWYEIRSPNATPAVFQQGTFAPDSQYRWMGSIAMDQSGDIAVGYSASGGSNFPAVRYTGRVPSDPPGTMESENSIIEGTGSQTAGSQNSGSRWGDYSGMSVDPVDDCTFWYTNEYLTTNGSFNWMTRIGSFKFASCGGKPGSASSLISSLSPSALGQAVTFTATVKPASGTGTPTGTVTFNDSATVLGMGTLSGGTVTFVTSGLGAGVHSITAVYGGDANFSGSTSPVLLQTVNQAPTSTSVTSSNSSSNRGAPVTFTATVMSSATGTPTGTVTFQDGTSMLGAGTLSGGRATFTTSGLITGPHSITAVYGGDANFTGSTSPVLTQTIGKAASSASVSSSSNPSMIGAAVTFTASVTSPVGGPPLTGTVTFHDGASLIGPGTLNGGTAAITTSALMAGAHSITAVYDGDSNYAGGTSPILTQTVNKEADSTSVASSNTSSIFGTSVTFTATVTHSGAGSPTGMVTFQDGASTLGTGMLSGVTATFTTAGLTGGVHSITAVYAGDASFAGSTSPTLTQTVADFSLSASPAATTVTAGSTATYMVTINPTGGFNQTISFKCSGAPMTAVCTAPASVSATGGSYAPFNVTVSTMAHSLAPPGVAFPFSGGGLRLMLEWLLALAACGILSGGVTSGRSRGWRVSSVAMLVLLVCAGCATTRNGSNPPPNSGTTPGTYSLNLAGSSGSLSNTTMLSLTVK
jgi:hypothetical protein